MTHLPSTERGEAGSALRAEKVRYHDDGSGGRTNEFKTSGPSGRGATAPCVVAQRPGTRKLTAGSADAGFEKETQEGIHRNCRTRNCVRQNQTRLTTQQLTSPQTTKNR